MTVLKPYPLTASKQTGWIGLPNAHIYWRIKYFESRWSALSDFYHITLAEQWKKKKNCKLQRLVLKLKVCFSHLTMEELLLLLLHSSSINLISNFAQSWWHCWRIKSCSQLFQIIHVCPLQLPWQQWRERPSHWTHAALNAEVVLSEQHAQWETSFNFKMYRCSC